MQMLYQSDSYVVVQFDVPPAEGAEGPLTRGGFEIVDKAARREIFIEGLLADHFQRGVLALVDSNPTEEAFDAFIGGYTGLAQQPLVQH